MVKKLFICLLWLFSLSSKAYTTVQAKDVVVSIKPLHSLVQNIMGDTGEAQLLIIGNASPHGFQLKPSQLRTLHNARVIFYVDDSLETFFHNIFPILPRDVRKNAVIRNTTLNLLKYRTVGHGHDDHTDNTVPNSSDRYDAHIWLDMNNAKKIATAVAEELSIVYPENREIYVRNVEIFQNNIDVLDAKLMTKLKAVKDKPFVVFHDAYQYFEHRYELNMVGSVAMRTEIMPSIKHIKEIYKKIHQTGAVCIFHEPQFSDKLVSAITRDSNIKSATLDPIGFDIPAGANLYFRVIEKMAENFMQCLH